MDRCKRPGTRPIVTLGVAVWVVFPRSRKALLFRWKLLALFGTDVDHSFCRSMRALWGRASHASAAGHPEHYAFRRTESPASQPRPCSDLLSSFSRFFSCLQSISASGFVLAEPQITDDGYHRCTQQIQGQTVPGHLFHGHLLAAKDDGIGRRGHR